MLLLHSPFKIYSPDTDVLHNAHNDPNEEIIICDSYAGRLK